VQQIGYVQLHTARSYGHAAWLPKELATSNRSSAVRPTVGARKGSSIHGSVGAMNAAQRRLWRVRWGNSFKEVSWRLALDGLACQGERLHQEAGECVCVALGLVAYLQVVIIIIGTALWLSRLSRH
jgi:hypothetical protein